MPNPKSEQIVTTTRLYLGDSVYAQMECGMIRLATNNGGRDANVIFLEPHVFAELIRFAQRHGFPVGAQTNPSNE
jgi:hypothetical protein